MGVVTRMYTSILVLLLLSYITLVIPVLGQDLATGINQFNKKLSTNIEHGSPSDNFVLSPLSLHSTLSQALTGSGGRTQAELEAVLGVRRSVGLVDQYSTVTRNIPSVQTSNIVALNTGFTPARSFVKYLKYGFGAEVKVYDMINNKTGTVREINSIVAANTNNKIVDLIAPYNIGWFSQMILINAVYFKANWKTAFNDQDSFTAEFQTASLKNVMATYMNIEMQAKYDETPSLKILELPYDNENTSMVFFLPKSDKSSNNLMNLVSQYPLSNLKTVQESNVSIAIPRFKMTFKINLEPEMRKLGLQEMFTEKANFTYISNLGLRVLGGIHKAFIEVNEEGTEAAELKVSGGIHKAFMEVNEEGTEAAAATAVLFRTRSGVARMKKRFFADRSFMFIVYDSVNNIPVFIGKVADPSSNKQKVSVSSQSPQGYNDI